MTLRGKLGWIAMIPAVVLAGQATAQDTHYWTEQYGNRARLMGGAVIASASDLSSVYYNPGRLALVKNSELLLAGNVFEYTTIKLRQESRPDDIASTRFSLNPSLFAGEFRFGWLGKSRLAYSFMTRNFSEFNTQARLENSSPDIAGAPDLGLLTDSVRIDQKLSEYWAGITWATPVTDTLGVGVSTFLAVRNQRGLLQRTTQALFGDVPAVEQLTSEYRYHHWRALWKLGIGTQLRQWDVGLTVTTPGVKLFGSGSLGGDRSRVGVPGESGSLAFVDQQDISATYDSPWSVGIGGTRRFDRTQVHIGVEWFGSVELFDVLVGEPVAPLTGGELVDLSVRHELDSVVNVAVGASHNLSDKWEGYASARTDFSASVDGSQTNLAFTEWDLYHISVGATLHGESADFTTGVILAFGSSGNPPRIPNAQLESSYFRMTFILGFSFGFADDPTTQ